MKTSLTLTSFFLSLALPSVIAADSLGFVTPVALSPAILFAALVISFILLTVVSDYSRPSRFSFSPTRCGAARLPAQAAHRLAA